MTDEGIMCIKLILNGLAQIKLILDIYGYTTITTTKSSLEVSMTHPMK